MQAAVIASAGARTVPSNFNQQFCIVARGSVAASRSTGLCLYPWLSKGRAILVFETLGQAAG